MSFAICIVFLKQAILHPLPPWLLLILTLLHIQLQNVGARTLKKQISHPLFLTQSPVHTVIPQQTAVSLGQHLAENPCPRRNSSVTFSHNQGFAHSYTLTLSHTHTLSPSYAVSHSQINTTTLSHCQTLTIITGEPVTLFHFPNLKRSRSNAPYKPQILGKPQQGILVFRARNYPCEVCHYGKKSKLLIKQTHGLNGQQSVKCSEGRQQRGRLLVNSTEYLEA